MDSLTITQGTFRPLQPAANLDTLRGFYFNNQLIEPSKLNRRMTFRATLQLTFTALHLRVYEHSSNLVPILKHPPPKLEKFSSS